MATEKILNTRIQLKYDTLANWNSSTFIPKKGEMCIATVTTATKDSKGNIIHVPTVLVKVGDNENVFSALPFVSAPAADVYDWAKKDEATFVANFLNMKNGDQTMQSLLDGTFATDEELSTAIAGVQGQINAINTKLGDLSKLNTTYKTDLVGAINEALQAVEVGGTGSVVTVVASDVEGGKSYQVTQGGKNVGSAIFVPDDTAAIADAKKAGTDAAAALDAYKGEMTTALSGKANAADVYSTTVMDTKLAAKADKATVEQALEGKASTSALAETNAAVATKAEKTYVDTELGKKADTEAMTTALAGKVDNNTFTTELAKKQDTIPANTYDAYGAAAQVKSDIEGTLANYSTTEQVNTELNKKVDKVEGKSLISDTEIARLANLKDYDDKQVKADIAANAKAITDEAARADAAEKKALEDAKKYTDEKVAAHATAVTETLKNYSTTQQMNDAIDADVLVETERATGAEEALADRIKALEDVSHDFASADAKLKADLQAEIDADVKALADGAVKDNADAIAAINHTETGILATAKAYTDEVKATILGENDKLIETYDTLAEIGQWIENTGSDVTDLATAIANEATTRENADKAINETITTTLETKADASAKLTEAKGYTDTQVAALKNNEVKANADAIAAINHAETGILAQAKAYADGLADNYDAAGSAAKALTDAKAYADSLNHEDTTYSAAADGGLKLNADNSFAIDDSLVFVFDCGDASTKIN